MEPVHTLIKNQYHSTGLYEDILKRLGEQHLNIGNVSRGDIAGVDEFHVRGAQVSRELANQVKPYCSKVLDVGCGIGGPARMLADEFDCQVTGIDLNQEYIRTAMGLSELVGLRGKTNFIQSNALELPFKNKSFDVVWTQHVQMNIPHKLKFYSEIERVLSDQGYFAYYDIFKKGEGNINFPVPWANNESASFLVTQSQMEDNLERLCFQKLITTDETEKGREFLIDLFDKLEKNGPPKLGLNVLMGSSTKEKLGNILKGLEEGQIGLQSGIYVKRSMN